MRLDPELLDRPPAEGARVVALALCADAEDALVRLGDRTDVEALHDFRVAVRRLRATLRSWQAALGAGLKAKHLDRLRRVTRATGPARDAEVLLAWLDGARTTLPASYRGAVDWLADRVARRRERGLVEVETRAAERLRRLAPRLAARLARGAAAPAADGAPATFAAALTAQARVHARGLRERLGAILGAADPAPVHAARLEGKRLRYLLEPLRGLPDADSDEAVRALKALQDLLGELHDAHQARVAVEAAQVEAAAERVRRHRRAAEGGAGADIGEGYRPGLMALERLAGEHIEALHARLQERFLSTRATALLDLVYAVVAALEARAETPEEPVAVERRFLLLELPGAVAGGRAEEVEQGWLPGDRTRESVGLSRAGGAERPFRALAPRAGRAPLIEPISTASFEAFWPLTEGRRVVRRRHTPPSAPDWRVDEYLDRKLVVAVALPGVEGPPPGWLEPLVVREVTGERAYQDEALARRSARRPA